MTTPFSTATESRPAVRRQSCPRLISAAPAVSLLNRWRSELSVLQRRSPSSDAAGMLADCVRELVDAINAGDDVSLQLTIADAHAISRIPLSTLRWLCRQKAVIVGARKHDGVWYLDRLRFQQYLEHSDFSDSPPGQANAESAVSSTDDATEQRADLRVVVG